MIKMNNCCSIISKLAEWFGFQPSLFKVKWLYYGYSKEKCILCRETIQKQFVQCIQCNATIGHLACVKDWVKDNKCCPRCYQDTCSM